MTPDDPLNKVGATGCKMDLPMSVPPMSALPVAADSPARLELPSTPASLLPLVLRAMSATPDARLRQLMAALTSHLHRFVLENAVTEAEFEAAVRFVTGIGQATGAAKNEVILAADLLGISTLVALLNNPGETGDTGDLQSHAALLGPFWRAQAPRCEPGDSIARAGTPGVALEVSGTVFGSCGRPLAGATVDVWQASPVGLYENQDSSQPAMNLRGRFTTDEQGRYRLRSVRPAGYPVPTDGPCGELLRAQRRHPFRPAHLHFMVSSPRHKVLITQVFADDGEHLASDPVFGVTQRLVGHFEIAGVAAESGAPLALLRRDFHLTAGEPVFPHPPIP